MQASTPIYSFNTPQNDINTQAPYDPILKIFFACVLNSAVTLYQISKENIIKVKNIKYLNYSQIFKLAFTVTNPIIPALTLTLTAALITAIVLRLLNKNSLLFSRACNALSNFSIINTVALAGLTAFVHEMGHSILAKTFFKTPNIKIKVFPFLGGETTFACSYGLTKIGSFFGKDRALTLIAAGGFLASTAVCLTLTEISKIFGESGSSSNHFFQNLSLSQILSELVYAMISLLEKEPDYQNDFTYLMGAAYVHPILPISLLAATCLYSIYSVQIL